MKDVKALRFCMCIPCENTFQFHTMQYLFYLMTLSFKFDLFLKNFNLGHCMWVPYDKAFHNLPYLFT